MIRVVATGCPDVVWRGLRRREGDTFCMPRAHARSWIEAGFVRAA